VAERKAAGTQAPGAKKEPPAANGPTPAQHPICSVAFCPICLMVTAVGDASPELVEHLLVAGRELLLAVRAVIDARLETMEEEPHSGLQRIEID